MINNNEFLVVSNRKGTECAVFEDDGETAYLYLYEEFPGRITASFHLYDDRGAVHAEDVLLIWSKHRDKVAVFIFEELNAIFDVARACGIKYERLQVEEMGAWLDGFEEVFE